MQEKGCLANTSEPCETRFRKAPEALDAVDMGFAPGEFVTAIIHAEMLAIANIDKAIVTTPAVGIEMLSGSTFPRIMACSVALERSGTISV